MVEAWSLGVFEVRERVNPFKSKMRRGFILALSRIEDGFGFYASGVGRFGEG